MKAADVKVPRRTPDQLKQHREYMRDWNRDNPDKVRERELKRNYGITPKQYEELLTLQGGVCAICGSPPSEQGQKKSLAIDHCHETNMIRGLLCERCNRAIGLLGECTEIISRAIEYLTREAPMSLVCVRTKAPRRPRQNAAQPRQEQA